MILCIDVLNGGDCVLYDLREKTKKGIWNGGGVYR